MNPPPAARHLGEYELKELLGETSSTRTWLAEQVSVARRVIVEELTEESQLAEFLADVRAKAAVDHPLIGSVYEAIAQPGLCFCAYELLPGATLEARFRDAELFPPARLAHILRRVCDANLQHETLAHATSPITLDAIHLDGQGVIRLKNLAIAGPRDPQRSSQDLQHLGTALAPLVAHDQPGSTRLLTLLGWMRGESVDAPLSWSQVREYCEQIEHQLAEPPGPSIAVQRGTRSGRVKNFTLIGLAAAAIIIASIAASAFFPRTPKQPPILRTVLPPAITIPAGTYPTPDGTEGNLPAFEISAHEVTLGEYAEFLDMLTLLAKTQRERTFDHPSQPATKLTHQPANWPALLAATKANGTWQNRPVTLACPIIGVDWWDAAAYAEWKQAHLPTQEQWFAALSHQMPEPRSLFPSGWGPVAPQVLDRTPAGLLAMAGSVAEWTRSQSANPANPLGERLWVLMGGSYLKPGSNALTRELTNDRALQRPDIGFRIVFEKE